MASDIFEFKDDQRKEIWDFLDNKIVEYSMQDASVIKFISENRRINVIDRLSSRNFKPFPFNEKESNKLKSVIRSLRAYYSHEDAKSKFSDTLCNILVMLARGDRKNHKISFLNEHVCPNYSDFDHGAFNVDEHSNDPISNRDACYYICMSAMTHSTVASLSDVRGVLEVADRLTREEKTMVGRLALSPIKYDYKDSEQYRMDPTRQERIWNSIECETNNQKQDRDNDR